MTSPPESRLKVKMAETAYDYMRIFVGSSKGELPFETIIHRPIGITDLDDDDWVNSSPDELNLLLARMGDPNEQVLKEKRYRYLIEKAVAAGLIARSADGVLSYPEGKDRNTFLKPHRKAAEENVKKAKEAFDTWKKENAKTRNPTPPSKLTTNGELVKILESLKDDKDAQKELAFSKYLGEKQHVAEAVEKFPTTYRTRKGAYSSHPQEPLPWAKGLTKEQIKQSIAKELVMMLSADSPKQEDEAGEDDASN